MAVLDLNCPSEFYFTTKLILVQQKKRLGRYLKTTKEKKSIDSEVMLMMGEQKIIPRGDQA